MDVEGPHKFTEPCEKFEPQFWRKARCRTCFFTQREHPSLSAASSSRRVYAEKQPERALATQEPVLLDDSGSDQADALKVHAYDSDDPAFQPKQSPAMRKLLSSTSLAVEPSSDAPKPTNSKLDIVEVHILEVEMPKHIRLASLMTVEDNSSETPFNLISTPLTNLNTSPIDELVDETAEDGAHVGERVPDDGAKAVDDADKPDEAPSHNLIFLSPMDAGTVDLMEPSPLGFTEPNRDWSSSSSPAPIGLPMPFSTPPLLRSETKTPSEENVGGNRPTQGILPAESSELISTPIKDAISGSDSTPTGSPSPSGRRRHEKQVSLSSGIDTKMLGPEGLGKRKIKTSISSGASGAAQRHSIAIDAVHIAELTARHAAAEQTLGSLAHTGPPKSPTSLSSTSGHHTGDYSSFSGSGAPLPTPTKPAAPASITNTPLRPTKSHFFAGLRSSSKKDKEKDKEKEKDREKDKEKEKSKHKHKKSKTGSTTSLPGGSPTSTKIVPITAYTMEQILHSTNVAKPDTSMKEATFVKPFVAITPFDSSILDVPPSPALPASHPGNGVAGGLATASIHPNAPLQPNFLAHSSTAPAPRSPISRHGSSTSSSSVSTTGSGFVPGSSKKDKKKKDKEPKDKEKDKDKTKSKELKHFDSTGSSTSASASLVDPVGSSSPSPTTSPSGNKNSAIRLRSSSEAAVRSQNFSKLGPKGKSKSGLKSTAIVSGPDS